MRRFSLRKKKSNSSNHNNSNDHEPGKRRAARGEPHRTDLDETTIDPVYETLKIAAETRKMTLANYLQQRQQMLNKQMSLNSQGSSEPDIQSSPRASRHASRTESELTASLRPSSHQPGRLSIGKRCASVRLPPLADKCPLPSRHMSFTNSPEHFS